MIKILRLACGSLSTGRLIQLTCCLLLSMGAAQAKEQFAQKKVMRFAVIYTDEPPFVFSNYPAKYNGIVPKLVEAFGREIGSEVEFVPASRKSLEASIISGKLDFSWLAKEWVQNTDNLIFSDPVLNHREFLYSHEPFASSEKNEEWVKDKTICVRQDYKYPLLSRYFEQKLAKPIWVSSQVPIASLFLRKKCDLLYINEFRAKWEFQKLSPDTKIYRSARAINQTNQTFIFSKKWQSHLPKINQAIARMKASGELQKIVNEQTQSNQQASE